MLLSHFILAGSGFADPIPDHVSSQRIPVVPLSSPNQNVLTPSTLGIVVNVADPNSVSIGELYARERRVPQGNVIEVSFPNGDSVSEDQFRQEFAKIEGSENYSKLKGYALAFQKPFRVGQNQSITSAFAQGIANIPWRGNCNVTADNPDKTTPIGGNLTAKPAMMLYGGADPQSTIELIRRGISSDASEPDGEILLQTTNDRARSQPREESMRRAAQNFPAVVRVEQYPGNSLSNHDALIGFQTGLSNFPTFSELHFVPGAYADHLTSFGAALDDNKGQTTVAEIIRAGATGSYGTVREPCNFAGKFPDPERMARSYLRGETLLESYWKSVDMTTEGLFVGEPLARPFPLLDASWQKNILTLKINQQTLPFLREAISSLNREGPRQNHSPMDAVQVGLYSVDAGRPRLLQYLSIGASSKPGEILQDIMMPSADPKSLILAILVR